MPRHPFAELDRPYRRGVVLGLSLAELFIILAFLLLLTMIGYIVGKNADSVPRKEFDRVASENERLRDGLRVYEIRLEEINNLVSGLQESRNDLIAENEDLKEKLIRLTAENETLLARLGKAEPDAESGNRHQEAIESLKKEKEKLQQAIAELKKQNKDLLAKIDAMRAADKMRAAAKLGDQIIQTAADLGADPQALVSVAVSGAGKGQGSPCWYKEAKRPNGEDYERHLYLFDVKITDQHIFVKDIPAPTEKYRLQKTTLEFDRASLNKELDYAEFEPAFLPLKLAGDNKKIRADRRCAFSVRVWDETGRTNKSGYKEAHNIIVQGVFYTYEVDKAESPWPH